IIRYMVSNRCKTAVREALAALDIQPVHIELGEVELPAPVTPSQLELIREALRHIGLELIDDKQAALVAQIKGIIIKLVHYTSEPPRLNFSNFLSVELGYNYTYLSNLFSEIAGTTIEHFILLHKIERV